ncbi:N-acetyllactosaminide beta-1,6-N-acetylglucosaminyl-transferase-like [Lagopus leucura]|uniref:N-acetyllactosaminide beta-1,6-N-acetylglucosaminyl-transferase-like n=1 Tax=Lagopus leucura TaxID=30410 RepID=UPI001C672997|nr:N-acetyllactosaminide beta-1,6-N-acetylglucosaminyl-transferase-like [Lagopus leucura]
MSVLRYCFFVVLILSVSLPFVFYAITIHAQKSLRRLKFSVSSTLVEDCKALTKDKVSFLKENALKTSFGVFNCSEYITQNHYITRVLSAKEAAFPLAYIITLHKEFETFERLFRAVYMPQNVYCIHVDGKAPAALQQAVRRLVGCFPNAFLASRTERVVYGGVSRLRADLHCMRDLLASAVPWRYLLNACGQDFPLKTNWEIIQHLKAYRGKNITPGVLPPAHVTARTKYVHREQLYSFFSFMLPTFVHKAPPPHNLTLYFGSAYIAVTRPFVEFVLQDPRAIDLLAWSEDTYSPDEHFWVTLNRIPDLLKEDVAMQQVHLPYGRISRKNILVLYPPFRHYSLSQNIGLKYG